MLKLSWFGVVFSLLMLMAAPVRSQDAAAAIEWQTVIDGQISAF